MLHLPCTQLVEVSRQQIVYKLWLAASAGKNVQHFHIHPDLTGLCVLHGPILQPVWVDNLRSYVL